VPWTSEAETLAPAADIGGPAQPLLQVQNLVKHFNVGGGPFGSKSVVRAVDGSISISVDKGEVVGLRRRVRLRQVDHRAPDRRADAL
jgi:ABC-type glutathione transport system ATPase component